MLYQMIPIPRSTKKAVLLATDFIACIVAFFIMEFLSPMPNGNVAAALAFTLLTGVLASLLTGTNRVVLRSFGATDLRWMLLHMLILQAGYWLALVLVGGGALLTKIFVFGCSFGMSALLIRIAILSILEAAWQRATPHSRVAIYGAGLAGQQLSAALHASEEMCPVAFFDDNPSVQGSIIDGVLVHPPAKLQRFVRHHRIDRILLAIPSISEKRRAVLKERLSFVRVPIFELPPYNDLIARGNLLQSLQPIELTELLNREAVEIDPKELQVAYADKNVLVSGAGGSIGSELCHQIMQAGPACIILLDICEYALYSIDMALRKHPNAYRVRIVPVLGAISNRAKLAHELEKHDVQIVLHAAAYKHVPLVEDNPIEAGGNNILGTEVLATEAAAYGVERFIFVSTDKAVRPANVMGATKRFAELVIQDLQTRSEKTKFSIVRFGNVLSSSGSVIPLFQRQIEEGGPITVTDPNVTRYFMTIPEAARLVLMAGSLAEGGEVFVLDMGKPQKIDDMARKVVKLAGLRVRDESNPDGDIEILYTGLRPGEKMYEELFESSRFLATPHPKIMRAVEAGRSEIEMARALRQIRSAVDRLDARALILVLEATVEGFGPDDRHRRNRIALAKDDRDESGS